MFINLLWWIPRFDSSTCFLASNESISFFMSILLGRSFCYLFHTSLYRLSSTWLLWNVHCLFNKPSHFWHFDITSKWRYICIFGPVFQFQKGNFIWIYCRCFLLGRRDMSSGVSGEEITPLHCVNACMLKYSIFYI